MTPTLSEINIAILMITVVVFLFIWFERSEAAATVTRMTRMMSRVGSIPVSAPGAARKPGPS